MTLSAWGDPTRCAVALTSYAMAVLHSTGDGAARSIVDAAVADARLGSDPRTRARAYALQAEAAARSGRFRDAVAALRLAWLDLKSAGADGGGFNEGRLQGFEGVCELYIGTPERAHDQLERCLATLTAPRDQVQSGIIGTDLAIARLRADDVRSATTLLHDSENTTAATGGYLAHGFVEWDVRPSGQGSASVPLRASTPPPDHRWSKLARHG